MMLLFFWAKVKLLVLRLLSSSARLSGFPIYWIPDYRNFTAINNDKNNNNNNNNTNNNNNSMVSGDVSSVHMTLTQITSIINSSDKYVIFINFKVIQNLILDVLSSA
jgi:hypothetical protein